MNIIDTFSLSPIGSFNYEGDMNVIIDYMNSIEYKEIRVEKLKCTLESGIEVAP